MRNNGTTRKVSAISLLLAIGLIFSCCFFIACENDRGEAEKNYVFCIYEADLSEYNLDSRMNAAKEKMLDRLCSEGYPKVAITREGRNKLRVEILNVENPEAILSILNEPEEIKFVLPDSDETILTGDFIIKATAGFFEDKYMVQISLDTAGAAKLSQATSNNIGEVLEILISAAGEYKTIFSSRIMYAITNGVFVITGIESLEDARQLANQIEGGTFGISLSLVDFGTFKR